MVSQNLLVLRATLAASLLSRCGASLVTRSGAVLGAALARWIDRPPAVYGDADASVAFMVRRELEQEAVLLRRAHR